MSKLANTLIHKGYLKTDLIIDAFAEIPRVEFMPHRFRSAAEADIPIPLGYGHMMASPSVVAFMLELLRPERGNSVLVAGFGSGWVTAMLSFVVGHNGHVSSYDKSASMEKNARVNLAKFSFIERDHLVDMYTVESCGEVIVDKPYDRIIVLNAEFMECDLSQYLAAEGVMVAPVNNIINFFYKDGSGKISTEVFSSMTFLPL